MVWNEPLINYHDAEAHLSTLIQRNIAPSLVVPSQCKAWLQNSLSTSPRLVRSR